MSFFLFFSLLCGAIAPYAATEADGARAVLLRRMARVGLQMSPATSSCRQFLNWLWIHFRCAGESGMQNHAPIRKGLASNGA